MPRIFAVQLKDEPAERYEQWVNTPVYTHDYEDCVGWLGCELPEDGHTCEFAELAGDGAVTCASSSKVNRLRSENAKLRELISDMWRFTGVACKKYPRLFDPSAQGGQMVQLNHIDSFEQRMSELGIEVK